MYHIVYVNDFSKNIGQILHCFDFLKKYKQILFIETVVDVGGFECHWS
jgi:hypothetical protein